MNKNDLVKLALMGITLGITTSAEAGCPCKSKGNGGTLLAAKCGTGSCGGALPSKSPGQTAMEDNTTPAAPGSCNTKSKAPGSCNSTSQPENGKPLSEGELLSSLDANGKSLYNSLSADGKSLALKLASQTGANAYLNKNNAVKAAAQQMALKNAGRTQTTQNSASK